ncbi:sulfatase [Alteromonas gracilis]
MRSRGPLALALLAVVTVMLLVGYLLVPGDQDGQPSSAPTGNPAPTTPETQGPLADAPGDERASTEERPRTRPMRPAAQGAPNIMLVLMDDMRYDELKYTPNLRRYVTSRGLEFKNAFSPFPLCCPARASLVTGEYAHNHRVLYHLAPYGFGVLDDSVSIATAMQQAGYETGFTGKYLNLYGKQDSLVTGRPSIDYIPRGWSEWRAGLDTGWSAESRFAGSTYNYFAFTQNVNGVTTSNAGEYSSTVIGEDVTEMIDAFEDPERPWFVWANPVAPHHGNPVEEDDPVDFVTADGRRVSYQTPARPDWVKGLLDDEIPQAPGLPATISPERDLSDKPRVMRGQPEVAPEEREKLRDLTRQRAESVYAWDREFGRIVQGLKARGEYDDTVFVFTSDNGYFLGEHRIRSGKTKPHEPSLRVPLVVAGPGIPAGERYAPVTTADVTRTLLDLARAPEGALPGQDGASQVGLFERDQPWRYPILTEAIMPAVRIQQPGFESGLTTIGVRTGRYKFVRYGNGDEELYDLATDPLELDSRHDDPAYAATRERLLAVWARYRNCRGPGCQAPLPADLQVGVEGLRSQWRTYQQQNLAHFGVTMDVD